MAYIGRDERYPLAFVNKCKYCEKQGKDNLLKIIPIQYPALINQ
jgi:hypothetical protein